MRVFQRAIPLFACVLFLSLRSFSAPDDPPEPRLVYALVVPSVVNLSQSSAVPVQIKEVFGLGRMFPDTVTLKTDLGHFAGTTEKQLVVKKADNLFPEVKVCFDSLTQVPMQPCTVSLIVDEKERATARITIRQATTTKYEISPPWIPLGEKEKPWPISWIVYDQFGKPLAGVPGLVQYTLPGSPSTAVAGESDKDGTFRVFLPPAVCEGICTAQLLTATSVSDPYTKQIVSLNGAADLPNLVATLAVPKEIIYPIQEDVPVLISVSSRDGRPLPDAIDLHGFGPKVSVPLKQGIGKVFLPLHGSATGEKIDLVAAIEEKNGDELRTRVIGRASVSVVSYPTSIQLSVTPLAQRTTRDPIGTLTTTIRYNERPFAHLPVLVFYPVREKGLQFSVLETDAEGTVTCEIPPEITPVIYAHAPGVAGFVILKQDEKGRLIAWGHVNTTTGKFEADETFVYDNGGKPIVTKQPIK